MVNVNWLVLASAAYAVKHTMTGKNVCKCTDATPSALIKCILDKEKAGDCVDPVATDLVTYADGGLCPAKDGKSMVYTLGSEALSQMELTSLTFVSSPECNPGTALSLDFGTVADKCGAFTSSKTITNYQFEITSSQKDPQSPTITTFGITYQQKGSQMIDEKVTAVQLKFDAGCTFQDSTDTANLSFSFVDPGSVDSATAALALGSSLLFAAALF